MQVQVNDVIQLDPLYCEWGPLLVIVTEVRTWGVQGFAMIPEERGKAPSAMFIRVQNGRFVRIGAAEWIISSGEPPAEPEQEV